MVEVANTIWADGPSFDPQEPEKAEIREWGTWIENTIKDSVTPLVYGAVGDGVTNDNAAFSQVEASGKPCFLPAGYTFVITLDLQGKYYGPGKILKSGVELFGSPLGEKPWGNRLGQIANRTVVPAFLSLTNKQIMSRSRHFASDRISGLRLIYPNWYHSGNAEAELGGSITVTASIEYPKGEFHRVTWSGANSINIGNLSNSPASDEIPVQIPDGAEFFIRTYQSSATGIVYSAVEDPLNGEAADFGVSGIPDLTMGGTITNSGLNAIYMPIAILGTTSKPSVMIVGDSRESGASFDTPSPSSVMGYAARALVSMCGFMNLARGGERLAEFVDSHGLRLALAQYCTHVIIHSGINDFTAGQSAAGALSDLATIIGYFPGKEIWLGTVEPVTTSSDGWTTVSGQTIDAVSNAARVAFNDTIRAGIAGVEGYFDVADVLESGRNSGKWRSPAGTALTSDGTHANPAGYLLVEQNGIIDPRKFFRNWAPRPRFATLEEARSGKSQHLIVSPAALGPRPIFKATKNGTDQTGIVASTGTKITWSTAAIDTGGHFSTADARWTPPAGFYRFHGQILVTAGLVDAAQSQIRIAKNAATVAEYTLRPSGSSGHTLSVDCILEANGTDYFEVWVNLGGTGDKTVSGDPTKSYFEGHPL